MNIDRLDHLVLTVADVSATCAFYERVMGMRVVTFDHARKALRFGRQKINLHQAGAEFEPRAVRPVTGLGDLCFISETPMAEIVAGLAAEGVAVIDGPVVRSGALGAMVSVYFRDPDGNLIEVANYAG
ncbi:MAG: VOC family protein [Pseudomonadota bacterium]|nr:VOC family protein [Pseudomonadota bacterium]